MSAALRTSIPYRQFDTRLYVLLYVLFLLSVPLTKDWNPVYLSLRPRLSSLALTILHTYGANFPSTTTCHLISTF